MVDFDEQRCVRLLTAMLNKFFCLCNHACDTFEMKQGLKFQVLNAISKSVIDELFVIDFNERKYFTISVSINGEPLTGITIQKYYNIDNIIRNRLELDINLIEETTPDTDDDMKTIIKLAKVFRNKSISELKLHTYDNENMIDSVCLSCGYVVKIATILGEIAQDIIMDTYLVSNCNQETLKDTTLRMRADVFGNTFLRELCCCVIMHTNANEYNHGFLIDIKSHIKFDNYDSSDLCSYETVISKRHMKLEWVDHRYIWSILVTE